MITSKIKHNNQTILVDWTCLKELTEDTFDNSLIQLIYTTETVIKHTSEGAKLFYIKNELRNPSTDLLNKIKLELIKESIKQFKKEN